MLFPRQSHTLLLWSPIYDTTKVSVLELSGVFIFREHHCSHHSWITGFLVFHPFSISTKAGKSTSARMALLLSARNLLWLFQIDFLWGKKIYVHVIWVGPILSLLAPVQGWTYDPNQQMKLNFLWHDQERHISSLLDWRFENVKLELVSCHENWTFPRKKPTESVAEKIKWDRFSPDNVVWAPMCLALNHPLDWQLCGPIGSLFCSSQFVWIFYHFEPTEL